MQVPSVLKPRPQEPLDAIDRTTKIQDIQKRATDHHSFVYDDDLPKHNEQFEFEVCEDRSDKKLEGRAPTGRMEMMLCPDEQKLRLNTAMKPVHAGGNGALAGFIRRGGIAAKAEQVIDHPSKIRTRKRCLTILATRCADQSPPTTLEDQSKS